MKKNKLHRILISVASIVVILAVGGTFATLSDKTETVVNTFEAAHVDTRIDEKLDDCDIDTEHIFKKDVKVVNEGKSNCFVRARITVSPSSANVVLYNGEWNSDSFVESAKLYENDIFKDLFNMSSKYYWTYCEEDGFYYYLIPLKKGESTTSLFNAFSLKESADVAVYQESVLADASITEAFGNKEERLKLVKDTFNSLEEALPSMDKEEEK